MSLHVSGPPRQGYVSTELEGGNVIGALILGLVAGFIGKALMPGDDPGGFFATILLGLAGAALGWVIFTLGLGIGDEDAFDLGGLVGAIIGTMILLFIYRKVMEGREHDRPVTP
jgi:uncharacterized membrane protein YeaQ/YmgE (transglycosylase-associated protein family)